MLSRLLLLLTIWSDIFPPAIIFELLADNVILFFPIRAW